MKKSLSTITLVFSVLNITLSSVQLPAWSQTEDNLESINLGQARNSARQAIESLNGVSNSIVPKQQCMALRV